MSFLLKAPFQPAGGQPEAIEKLFTGSKKYPKQTLLGITGSGKTFVMAHLINKVQKPTLILAHNKTLAAQLYTELKDLFPENRVEYFISYYDYYQPESYLPTTDTYIEKDADVNEQIEKMRLKATTALMSRDDVIVVASISCIYGLGNPEDFAGLAEEISVAKKTKRNDLIKKLIDMQYQRNDQAPAEGDFRVRGDILDIFLPYDEIFIRTEFFGDEIERVSEHDRITGEQKSQLQTIKIFPAKQFVAEDEKRKRAMEAIRTELEQQLPKLADLEAHRLKKRVMYDLEMLKEVGYCSGIENYSRHFDGRDPGVPPYTLLNYFPKDFLFIIDESHQSIPQSRAMYHGDYARKKNLVDFGFRLPSAFDNRPLKFNEFETYMNSTVFVSATPGPYELEHSKQVVELIIRPTGLVDPLVEVRKTQGQIQDVITEIKKNVDKNERVLITTLTKRMAEDLTDYLAKEDIKVRYLHSEIDSLDRIELIRGLRAGEFDVLVGINLLREGLDLPEVSLIAILDADKEGFLRDERSLIQTIGRAARNVHGRVIMYADSITESMQKAIATTKRRREEQIKYNEKHNITPQNIKKRVQEKTREIKGIKHLPKHEIEKKLIELDAEMHIAAEKLDFERAILLRDTIEQMKRAQENEEKQHTKRENT